MPFVDFEQNPVGSYNGFIWLLQTSKIWKLANTSKDVSVRQLENDKWLARVGVMEIVLFSEDDAKDWCQKNL